MMFSLFRPPSPFPFFFCFKERKTSSLHTITNRASLKQSLRRQLTQNIHRNIGVPRTWLEDTLETVFMNGETPLPNKREMYTEVTCELL